MSSGPRHAGALATATLAHVDLTCRRLLSRNWPSCVLVALLQIKLMWNIWLFRDLTSGDTSSNFLRGAYPWSQWLADNIVWSPLYTAFYGTMLMLTGQDVYLATVLHRVVIAVTASLCVAIAMRRLLPPSIALLIALWWTVLPINFDTLYEVHLFGLLPVLAAWCISMSGDSAGSQGTALGILLASTALVRNELIVLTALFAVFCIVREIARAKARGPCAGHSWVGRLGAYGLPVLVAVTVVLLFYWRSYVKYPEITAYLADKHTVNMCQVYAFGYSQRHPEWAHSPWADCQPLMQATFGRLLPSLRQMMESNPGAVLEHFWWNLSLLPAGMEVALFNAMSGTTNPDYVPVVRTPIAGYLGLGTLTLVGVAAVVGWRRRERCLGMLRERATGWIIAAALLCMCVPIILTQRPRPSYLFAGTLVVMAVTGAAMHVLATSLRAERMVAVAAVAGGILLIIVVPPYYSGHRSDRPLYGHLRRLEPYAAMLRKPGDRILFGDYSRELTNYLWLPGASSFDYGLLSSWDRRQDLDEFLDGKDINVVYLQPRMMDALRNAPEARRLLGQSAETCWRRVAPAAGSDANWLLLRREDAVTAPMRTAKCK